MGKVLEFKRKPTYICNKEPVDPKLIKWVNDFFGAQGMVDTSDPYNIVFSNTNGYKPSGGEE